MRNQCFMGATLPVLAGLVASVVAGVPRASAEDQESKSSAAARELTKQLDTAKMTHIAARDPENPNRFVAAMFLPGLQIVTVSGTYSVPVLLNEKLLQKNYEGIYLDLMSASDRESRVLIEDYRADGLPTERLKSGPADIFEKGPDKVTFDWDWKKQKLSEKDFMDRLATADAAYTRLLSVLLEQAKVK